MPNHLTPDEIAKEHGIERREVLRICAEEHVPVLNGRIDRSLFDAVVQLAEVDAPTGSLT